MVHVTAFASDGLVLERADLVCGAQEYYLSLVHRWYTRRILRQTRHCVSSNNMTRIPFIEIRQIERVKIYGSMGCIFYLILQ